MAMEHVEQGVERGAFVGKSNFEKIKSQSEIMKNWFIVLLTFLVSFDLHAIHPSGNNGDGDAVSEDERAVLIQKYIYHRQSGRGSQPVEGLPVGNDVIYELEAIEIYGDASSSREASKILEKIDFIVTVLKENPPGTPLGGRQSKRGSSRPLPTESSNMKSIANSLESIKKGLDPLIEHAERKLSQDDGKQVSSGGLNFPSDEIQNLDLNEGFGMNNMPAVTNNRNIKLSNESNQQLESVSLTDISVLLNIGGATESEMDTQNTGSDPTSQSSTSSTFMETTYAKTESDSEKQNRIESIQRERDRRDRQQEREERNRARERAQEADYRRPQPTTTASSVSANRGVDPTSSSSPAQAPLSVSPNTPNSVSKGNVEESPSASSSSSSKEVSVVGTFVRDGVKGQHSVIVFSAGGKGVLTSTKSGAKTVRYFEWRIEKKYSNQVEVNYYRETITRADGDNLDRKISGGWRTYAFDAETFGPPSTVFKRQ